LAEKTGFHVLTHTFIKDAKSKIKYERRSEIGGCSTKTTRVDDLLCCYKYYKNNKGASINMKLRPICNFTEILSEVKEDDDNID